jgi:hypothetical protein
MLMKMNVAKMWWLQSIFGRREGGQKPNHLLHCQIIVNSTHIHKHLLDIDRHYSAACQFEKEVLTNNDKTPSLSHFKLSIACI